MSSYLHHAPPSPPPPPTTTTITTTNFTTTIITISTTSSFLQVSIRKCPKSCWTPTALAGCGACAKLPLRRRAEWRHCSTAGPRDCCGRERPGAWQCLAGWWFQWLIIWGNKAWKGLEIIVIDNWLVVDFDVCSLFSTVPYWDDGF